MWGNTRMGNQMVKEHTLNHDGRKYVGGWNDGLYHGQGTYTLPKGMKYEGVSDCEELEGVTHRR
jgi:hypothetical protein